MENTAQGGVLRDKYSTRRSRVLYLFRDTSLSAVFFIHTSTGSALGGILYFVVERWVIHLVTLNELGLWICIS